MRETADRGGNQTASKQSQDYETGRETYQNFNQDDHRNGPFKNLSAGDTPAVPEKYGKQPKWSTELPPSMAGAQGHFSRGWK
jgi:hypothetical protein